jgi:glycosyltransferase involved in cell wall biosynthesis
LPQLRLSVVVCAYNEERYLAACLHSLHVQSRRPDEIVVVDNASTDATRWVADSVPRVRVVDEPARGLVKARAAGMAATTGDVLCFLDADCRASTVWLERIERRFLSESGTVAVTGPYRYYDWDWMGRFLLRGYDLLVAPAAHLLAQDVLRVGALLYGGNFAVRRAALEAIGGFDTTIEFHGEDTNLARRLARVGRVRLVGDCWLFTSARRYRALGRGAVFRLYIRNCWAELVHHAPRDRTHIDVRN